MKNEKRRKIKTRARGGWRNAASSSFLSTGRSINLPIDRSTSPPPQPPPPAPTRKCMSIKTWAGVLEHWIKNGCKSLDLFPSGSCVTRVARIAFLMRARALRASPPAGSGAQNEAATLLRRGTTCARQHCGTLFSPRGTASAVRVARLATLTQSI